MNDSIDYKKLYKEKDKEVSELKKELQSKKDIIEKSKIKLSKYYDEIKEKDNIISELKIDIKNLNDVNINKEKVIETKDLKIKELQSMKDKFNTLISNNKTLRNQVNSLKANINKLKAENENSITDTEQLSLKESLQRESKLLEEISGLKNNSIKLKNIIDEILLEKDKLFNSKRLYKSISSIIDLLGYELSLNNVDSYRNIFKLSKRVNLLLERKKSYKDINNIEKVESSNEAIWGYTFEEDNEIKFIDMEGKYYYIQGLGDFIKIDTPAKAIKIDDNTVQIEMFYNELIPQIFSNNKQFKKSEIINEEQLNDNIINIGNYNVMIITGRNGKHYMKYLNLYGLNVLTFDPFQENLNLLNEKAKSQDIILVMKNAIPHAVTDIIDTEDKRFQIISRDNKKYLLARIRYYLANYING